MPALYVDISLEKVRVDSWNPVRVPLSLYKQERMVAWFRSNSNKSGKKMGRLWAIH